MNATKTLTRTFGALALAAALAMATVLTAFPCPSRADDEGATIGEVNVSEVAATPAKAGETTRITFSVENGGSEQVTVTGVRWPTGELGRVVGSLGTTHSTAMGGLPVAAGEVLQLDGRTAWIEVGPLGAHLAPGSVVQARLVLGRFAAPLSVHVSPTPEAAGAVSPGRETASVGPAWWRIARC